MTAFQWIMLGWVICIVGLCLLFRWAHRPAHRLPIYLDDQEMAALLTDLDQLPTTAEDDTR